MSETFLRLSFALGLTLNCITSGAQSTEKPIAQQTSGDFTLAQLVALSVNNGLLVQLSQADLSAAKAAVIASGAYPNPEVEFVAGPGRGISQGSSSGLSSSIAISQRIEFSALRDARRELATAGVLSAQLNNQTVQNNVTNAVKSRYFDALRRAEELNAAKEELTLTEQIKERVRVRFSSGEGARFDLLKAETEVAIALNEVNRGAARLSESRELLRQAVGPGLPRDYGISGSLALRSEAIEIERLFLIAINLNPEIKFSQAEVIRAERLVEYEKSLARPSLAIRVSQDKEPDFRSTRAGVIVNVPLWDQRTGPIAQAQAQAVGSRTQLALTQFSLEQTILAAWQQYQASLSAVQALEGIEPSDKNVQAKGILQRARNVVDIAEAAYRFGERGILEYLDARRQFRAARSDLITARFELQIATSELERLAALDFRKP